MAPYTLMQALTVRTLNSIQQLFISITELPLLSPFLFI